MKKGLSNLELSQLLQNVAAAYTIKDGVKNKFRIVAYENAATAIEHLSSEAKDLWDEAKLEDVPGVGPNIANHLADLFKTGKSNHFNEVLDGIPPATFEIIKLPGIGSKTAFKLVKELHISNSNPLTELKNKAIGGKIEVLEGFGVESQKEILAAIEQESRKKDKRLLYSYAWGKASEILDWMRQSPSVKRIEVLGSLRRRVSTIGDIDIAVVTDNPEDAITHFVSYKNVSKITEKGDVSASILLPGNIQIDLMVAPEESFGSLLQHFTGSKHHNIALREYALKKGFSLSEYGMKKVGESSVKKFKDEESFYKYLGLNYIAPELREDSGEIEAAKEGNLPTLVDLKDIKGDLQIHSSFDIETSHDFGTSSMEEVVREASKLGYEYIAFTEHNPSQRGHSENQVINLLKKKEETVRKTKWLLKVFNSLEIDILPDGRLPVPEAGLATLDFALVSIHSSFDLSKEAMTKRILTGLSHPKVKILAHPSARILNKRESIEADWEKIFDYCFKNNKWLEINADPARLDLPDFLVKDAVKRGVKLTLGTDAHNAGALDNMGYGVDVVRRGWGQAKDIVNTRNLAEFEKLLK